MGTPGGVEFIANAERAELPRAEELRGSLVLADRGYFDVK
jgi:hypothetical protein